MSLRVLPPVPDSRCSRTWAEIDLTALAENVAVLRGLGQPFGEPMAVVKADAYGHGAAEVARACERNGVGHFGVACVDEGRSLRRAGITAEIYVLSPFLPEEAPEIIGSDLIPFVSSPVQLQALRDAAAGAERPARCFLAIDTGMGREGCLPEEAVALYRAATVADRQAGVRITGVVTHFSRADEPGIGDDVSAGQAERFVGALRTLNAISPFAHARDGRGGRGLYLSLANSPATLRLDHGQPITGARGFLMRCGLLTYGIEPYADAYADCPDVHAILSWRTRVTLLRHLPTGATVGYGQTRTLARPSRIATLAVGYADGLSRKLSNRGVILLRGRRYSIVGRVSMDQCQVDVTDAGDAVSLGDVATLIGADGAEGISALEMAELIGTTPHEPTCALTARVPRLYLMPPS
jgi:alanine racemase